MSELAHYLNHVRLIKASGIATDERSYYPALDALFNAIGHGLGPRVVAIHDIAGPTHPDYALQVETTHDLRAAVEVKPAFVSLDDLAQSEQVKGYLRTYGLCLITNLREFALVRPLRGGAGHVECVMRYPLASGEAEFWNAPPSGIERRHADGLRDFLITVLTWEAPLARPKDLAEALARYAREALRRLEHGPKSVLDPLRDALSRALGLRFEDEQGEHFFRSSLVQTLFYGLFSAWVAWSRANPNADVERFRWREAGDHLHLPVLRELFEHFAIPSQLQQLQMRQPLEWAEATLRRTAWDLFAAAFAEGDAVNYFYEPFLEAYDPHLREQLGVWYT
ncbi:MAG: DNA methyltransferase, partial [Ktedonobacterales bacterium]|nr:DNA methyltransferase [Ktedonobacterales bacterium]